MIPEKYIVKRDDSPEFKEFLEWYKDKRGSVYELWLYYSYNGFHDDIKRLDAGTKIYTPAEFMKLVRVEQPTDFQTIANGISSLLEYKNKNYGNSALEPLQIFGGKTKVGTRLDDKLARIKNSDTLRKNDVADAIGYLFLVCKENNWNNFEDLKD